MEATTPELGPVHFWSPKSSSFSGSASIVVEETAKNFLSPWLSVNKSGTVEDSKLRRYLVKFGRTLEQFLQRRMSSTMNVLNDSIIFLLGMPFDPTDW